MERYIENPMVCDDLWSEIDEIEREIEEAAWYKKADDDYDDWKAMREG